MSLVLGWSVRGLRYRLIFLLWADGDGDDFLRVGVRADVFVAPNLTFEEGMVPISSVFFFEEVDPYMVGIGGRVPDLSGCHNW